MERDWGGLRRKSLMIKPRILMYPRRMALRGLCWKGSRERERCRCVFKIGDGRDGGVDGKGSYRWGKGGEMCEVSGGWEGGVGWGIATHSP
jgi:hypothetical protein